MEQVKLTRAKYARVVNKHLLETFQLYSEKLYYLARLYPYVSKSFTDF